jgi:cell division septation protein DedD
MKTSPKETESEETEPKETETKETESEETEPIESEPSETEPKETEQKHNLTQFDRNDKKWLVQLCCFKTHVMVRIKFSTDNSSSIVNLHMVLVNVSLGWGSTWLK